MTFMMVVMLSMGFASCSSDDDDSTGSALAGHWQECKSDGKVIDDATNYEVMHMKLQTNGKGEWWTVTKGKEDNYKYSFNYTYTLNGTSGKVTMTITESTNAKEVGKSQSTSFTLIDGILHAGEIYYKRISQ